MKEFLSFVKDELINDIKKIPKLIKGIAKIFLGLFFIGAAIHSIKTSKLDFFIAIMALFILIFKI